MADAPPLGGGAHKAWRFKSSPRHQKQRTLHFFRFAESVASSTASLPHAVQSLRDFFVRSGIGKAGFLRLRAVRSANFLAPVLFVKDILLFLVTG